VAVNIFWVCIYLILWAYLWFMFGYNRALRKHRKAIKQLIDETYRLENSYQKDIDEAYKRGKEDYIKSMGEKSGGTK